MSSTFYLRGPSGPATPSCDTCGDPTEPHTLNGSGPIGIEAVRIPTARSNAEQDSAPSEPAEADQRAAAGPNTKNRDKRAADPDALTIDEVIRRGPGGKGKVYAEIAEGRLVARKLGRRTVVLRADYEKWLNNLPLLKAATNANAASSGTESPSPPRKTNASGDAE